MKVMLMLFVVTFYDFFVNLFCFSYYMQVFLRKMLGTRFGSVGTRFL